MPDLPSGTVTLLFTDIEGSTRLLRVLRERYQDVLAEHRRLLRGAFAEHGGNEIGTEGDSFFVVFRRAKDAVAAAADGQRALAEYPWPEGAVLRVRMGLHTGEPSLAEANYVGLGVHRAARIMAAGHGGQILLSPTTRELVLDDPPPDIGLRDLGEQRLKDFDQPEHIYQLVVPGLPSEFPPLKTLRRFDGVQEGLRQRGDAARARPRNLTSHSHGRRQDVCIRGPPERSLFNGSSGQAGGLPLRDRARHQARLAGRPLLRRHRRCPGMPAGTKRCDLSSGIVTDETARTVTFHLVAPIWTGSDPALTQVAQTFVPLLERLGFEAHLKVVPDRVYRQTVNDSRTRARRWARR
jgi:class 3 adenylate cyclase